MSIKARAVLEQIRTLPISDQRELLRELQQQVGTSPSSVTGELYGEPLTDEDIEETARITFQMLDDEDKRAGSR